MICTETIVPRLTDYNAVGHLRAESLLQLLENSGVHHTHLIQDTITSNGIAWVLLDWRVERFKNAAQFEPLTVSTWVHGRPGAPTFFRDYTVSSLSGERLYKASSKFALVDLAAGHMARIPQELFNSYGPEDKAAFEAEAPRLRMPVTAGEVSPFNPLRDDFDYNGHLHNTRYISYALEALPETLWRRDAWHSFRIVYRAPILPGMHPEFHRTEDDNRQILTICSGEQICTVIEIEMTPEE